MSPEGRAIRFHQTRRLRLIGFALVGASAVLVLCALLSARQIASTSERLHRQLQTNGQAPVLNDTLFYLASAETGQRGYLLTGKHRYLATYENAVAMLPGLMRSVDDMGRLEPAFAPHAQRIRALADAKLAEMARTLALDALARHDEAIALVQTDAGQGYMEQLQAELRAKLAGIRSERGDLAQSIILEGRRSTTFVAASIAALLTCIVLAALQLRSMGKAVLVYENALRSVAEIFEASPDAIIQTDGDGVLTYLNKVARVLFVDEAAAMPALSPFEFHTAETRSRFERGALAEAHEKGAWVGETTVRVAGGRIVPMNHLLIAHKNASGEVERYSTIMRDISAELADRDALKLQTATLTSVIEAVPAMIAVYDTQCRYRLVNRAFEAWSGVRRDACIGSAMDETFAEGELGQSRPWADKALSGLTVSFEKTVAKGQRDRQVSVSYVPLRLDDGTIDGFIGVGQDVTLERDEARRLTRLSELDPLTSLRNRAGLEIHLKLRIATGGGKDLAILFIDLDHFKPVNDRHGHAAGDEVLRQFGRRMEEIVRPADVAARLGGDEFAVALSGVRSLQDAERIAAKIVAMATRPFDIGQQLVVIGASVGIAHGVRRGEDWQGLLARADQALYEAKRAGRGRLAAEPRLEPEC